MQETHNLIWVLSYILYSFNSRVFESAGLYRLLAVVGCCLVASGLWLFVRHLRSGLVRRHRFGRFVKALVNKMLQISSVKGLADSLQEKILIFFIISSY